MEGMQVIIEENPVQLTFDDPSFNVYLEELNTTISVSQEITQVEISSSDIKILTIAEQGPPGVGGGSGGLFPMSVGLTPPSNPSVGDLWLDMN
jgi:hypothetical protein